MKTDGGLTSKAHMLGHALMRRMPQVRQMARRGYWNVQSRRYDSIARSIATDRSVVFFEAFGGRNYTCSPRAIYECMIADERFNDFTFVWSFKEGCVPEGADKLARAALVQRGSKDYYEALAVSGTIIVNNRLPEYVFPKLDQTYVQCWHGTPLKRLGYDVQVETTNAMNTTSELAERFGMDMRKWTYLLSPSAYTTEHLSDAFGLPPERRAAVVLELGYPRNDVLALRRGDAEAQAAIRERLGIAPEKKVLLYAPTWRDDQYVDGVGYSFEMMVDFDELKRQLGEEWVVLFRAHYYIANSFDFSSYGGFVVDVSRESDINELYLASDVLLTDYSSTMFDYANLHRPIMLYCPDLNEYATATRGFYFDINEVPGPLCATVEELAGALAGLDGYWQRYGQDYERFQERFCPNDDGNASARVVDALFA